MSPTSAWAVTSQFLVLVAQVTYGNGFRRIVQMSKMKQTYVCLAGVFGITCLFACVTVLCSCSDLSPVQEDSLKDGFVDACYTVLEYNPKDGDARILKYLNSRVSAKELTKEEADMMLRCLKRTISSNHWKKEKE